MIYKILKFIVVLIIVALAIAAYFYFQFEPSQNPAFGITFSDKYAASLGFDPMIVYMDMLTDLKPKKIRLVAYWDEIEKEQGKFDFKNLDRMLTEAQKRGVDVIMVVGKKVPRWPECHHPSWFNSLDKDKQDEAVIAMINSTVGHLKQYSAIKAWQVENEPYFVFGIDCPKQGKDFLLKETTAVRQIDSRPIVMTASGEQGDWNQMSKAGADIVGATMYRTVYSERLGYYKYPVGPWFYRIKAGYLKKVEGKRAIGVELQAEPWLLSGIFHTKVEEQKTLMNEKVFKENIDFARKTGFSENYLWGVEWWYWMAKKQDDWTMWANAKDLLAK